MSHVYQIYHVVLRIQAGIGGDLRGLLRARLFTRLGGAIWLSLVYKSPNDDNGYEL